MNRKKAIRVILVFLAVLAVAAAIFRRPFQRWIFVQSVLNANGPSEQELDEVYRGQPSASDAVLRLWSAQMLPHRHYAMQSLRRYPVVASGAWAELAPLVIDAAASRDVDLLEPGMMVYCRNNPPDAESAALALLTDADPEVRLVGIRGLMQLNDRRHLNRVIDCLADPDHMVRVQSKLALQTLSHDDLTIDVDLAKPDSIRDSQKVYRDWAIGKFGPFASEQAAPAVVTTPIAAPEIAAVDTDGVPVRLSLYRGTRVLLNIWTTWCPPCRHELPILAELQKRHKNDLAIIGVCADSVRDDDGDGGAKPQDTLPKLQALMKEAHVDYPMILESAGPIVATYDGSGVPLSIVIDENGFVRRRFVGARSLQALEEMIKY